LAARDLAAKLHLALATERLPSEDGTATARACRE
jgi:hypothetical protein